MTLVLLIVDDKPICQPDKNGKCIIRCALADARVSYERLGSPTSINQLGAFWAMNELERIDVLVCTVTHALEKMSPIMCKMYSYMVP